MGWLAALYDAAADAGARLRSLAAPVWLDGAGGALSERAGLYALMEHYDANSLFDNLAAPLWRDYKARYGLPRLMRSLFNPTTRAVDWYPGAIYPGPEHGGDRRLIPWPEAAMQEAPAMVAAGEAALRWGGWPVAAHLWVRQTVLLGNTIIEIQDDLARRQVYPCLIHPRHVVDLALSPAGDVVRYAIAFRRTDPAGKTFLYRKEVNAERIATFRDDEPWDPDGLGAERANPYGFVPAVWTRFRPQSGSVYGTPLILPALPKIEALNAAASAIHDYVLKFIHQGAILATNSSVAEIQRVIGQPTDPDQMTADRESVGLWRGPADLRVWKLIDNLGLGEAVGFIERLLEEIEADLPELTVDRRLQEMAVLTGPGAERALGEVKKRHRAAMAEFDLQLGRIVTMCLAIGGWRLNAGAWDAPGGIDPARQAFRPFDLDTHRRGEVRVELEPRPLVVLSERERVDAILAKEAIRTRQGLIELYGPEEGNRIFEERQRDQADAPDLLARAFGRGDF